MLEVLRRLFAELFDHLWNGVSPAVVRGIWIDSQILNLLQLLNTYLFKFHVVLWEPPVALRRLGLRINRGFRGLRGFHGYGTEQLRFSSFRIRVIREIRG